MTAVTCAVSEYLQPAVAESRPPWLLVVLLLLLLIALLLLLWLCCFCWKRHRAKEDETDGAGAANRRRVFEEEGRENKGFVDGEAENKVRKKDWCSAAGAVEVRAGGRRTG